MFNHFLHGLRLTMGGSSGNMMDNLNNVFGMSLKVMNGFTSSVMSVRRSGSVDFLVEMLDMSHESVVMFDTSLHHVLKDSAFFVSSLLRFQVFSGMFVNGHSVTGDTS